MSLMERIANGAEEIKAHEVVEEEITTIMRSMYGVMLLSEENNPALAKIIESWRTDLIMLRNAVRKLGEKENARNNK